MLARAGTDFGHELSEERLVNDGLLDARAIALGVSDDVVNAVLVVRRLDQTRPGWQACSPDIGSEQEDFGYVCSRASVT